MSLTKAPVARDVERPDRTAQLGRRERAPRLRTRATILFVVLGLALATLIIVSASSGQLRVPPGEVLSSIAHKLGLGGSPVAPRMALSGWPLAIGN